MNKKFYITTSIPYVNADPHIGFALEAVQTDVQARYHRLINDDVRFLSGTDENALKNVQASEKAGKPVKEFIDEKAKNFSKLHDSLNLSWDDFIRTTEQRHIDGVNKFWLATRKEDIYKKVYKGLYCVGCEVFYEPDELTESGECFEHPGKKVEEVEEENYFFKLSNYQSWLENLIEKGEVQVFPEIRKNEVLGFIKRGLQDFSISRTKERAKGWGIPVPGDANQVIYVWYDALTNYITALDYANNGELYQNYWTNNSHKTHVIGKGISRFHAIYWLAMLKSADVSLPTQIFVHGYITSKGQKISKSLGNVIDPFEQVDKFGTDAVRYFLLREIPSYGDGDYTEERFKEVYNADLANGLGNLVARIAKLCETNNYHWDKPEDWDGNLSYEVTDFLDNFRFDLALNYIWGWIKGVDQYIEKERPWQKRLSHEDKSLSIDVILNTAVTDLVKIATNLRPFLPETADKILNQFAGPTITSGAGLFPRI